MTVSDPQSSALLDHIVSQVQNDIEFLVSQGLVTPTDASQFLSKLPRSGSTVQNDPVAPTPTPRPSVPPPPASTSTTQARALWAYGGQDPGDLALKEGDIIEITEETNEDWWKGRLNGRQGIFPASYVEKIQAPVVPAGRPVYKPFRAAYHGMDQPPPPTSTPAQGGQTNSLGLQEAPGKEQKKSKFGGLGNTMANSAAGGVGFGAGAAIGGGLVRAIF